MDWAAPEDFSLSASAKTRISQIMRSVHAEKTKTWIPAIVWTVDTDQAGNLLREGPAVGGYDETQVPKYAIHEVSEMTIVFALTDKTRGYFNGKILNFDQTRDFFLEPK